MTEEYTIYLQRMVTDVLNPLSLVTVLLYLKRMVTMISRLKLLQSKYSLSNEFMVRQLQLEIERQAALDIGGIVNNCSVSMIEDAIGSFTLTETVDSVDATIPAIVTTSSDVAPAEQHKNRGKKRR